MTERDDFGQISITRCYVEFVSRRIFTVTPCQSLTKQGIVFLMRETQLRACFLFLVFIDRLLFVISRPFFFWIPQEKKLGKLSFVAMTTFPFTRPWWITISLRLDPSTKKISTRPLWMWKLHINFVSPCFFGGNYSTHLISHFELHSRIVCSFGRFGLIARQLDRCRPEIICCWTPPGLCWPPFQ